VTLTDRDRRIAAGLRQWRMLTTGQVRDLWLPTTSPHLGGTGYVGVSSQVGVCLRRLEAAGLARSFAGRRGREEVWHLTRVGWEATRGEGDDRPYGVPESKANGAKMDLLHHLSVADVGIAFVQAARERGDRCGPHDVTFEVKLRTGAQSRLISDAHIHYELWEGEELTEAIDWLIELERDKKSLTAVMRKLESYHKAGRFVREGELRPEWERWFPAFPHVLVVVRGWEGHQTSEGRLRSVLTAGRHREILQREEPPIWFATFEDVMEQGALAPVWRTIGNDERRPIW
jgi:protein involved in plasmid replication-relaxation